MVKHVVRPLKSGFLYDWSLPKRAVFSRVLGIWKIRRTINGNCVPNVALYQAEPHLVINLFYKVLRLLRPRSVKNIVVYDTSVSYTPYFFPCRTRFISHRERSRSKHSALRVERLLLERKYHNFKAYTQAKIKGEHLLPFDFLVEVTRFELATSTSRT